MLENQSYIKHKIFLIIVDPLKTFQIYYHIMTN